LGRLRVGLAVYNLEFRPHCTRLEIDGYVFERVPDYSERRSKLQSLINSAGSEGYDTVRTGEHVHTANVTGPSPGPSAVIPWQFPNATAIDDILLLLKLFTQRDVFTVDFDPNQRSKPFAILADPRCFPWGGILVCSIPYESECPTGEPLDTIDTSLQVHLPQIYGRMKDPEWRRLHKGGYFLVLLSEAIQQRSVETAFSHCWTIWEHLFACLNDPWMSASTIRGLSSKEKIAFLLVHFEIRVHLENSEKSRLDALVEIRNRLIHYGQFPDRATVRADAIMFIRMTEYIAAKALGLFPSNVFNTVELLEAFLQQSTARGT
jgi:hypothetical protein